MARFKFVICCFPVLAAICVADVLQKREHGIRLAVTCVHMFPKSHHKLPVIMLHGLTDIKETWYGLFRVVSFFTDRRVCVYDARNHGNSGWNDTFNIDVLADDLESLMDEFKIEKASLVGHSLGGLTAMKFALRHPEKVESMVVEDIAPNTVSKEKAQTVSTAVRFFLESLAVIPPEADEETAKKTLDDYLNKTIGFRLPDHFSMNHPLRRRNGKWEWKANYEVFIKAFENAEKFVGKMEGRYDGRVLFIYGTASPNKVNEQEEHIRKLFPKAEFSGVEGAGHDIHPAYKSVFERKLVDFLEIRGN